MKRLNLFLKNNFGSFGRICLKLLFAASLCCISLNASATNYSTFTDWGSNAPIYSATWDAGNRRIYFSFMIQDTWGSGKNVMIDNADLYINGEKVANVSYGGYKQFNDNKFVMAMYTYNATGLWVYAEKYGDEAKSNLGNTSYPAYQTCPTVKGTTDYFLFNKTRAMPNKPNRFLAEFFWYPNLVLIAGKSISIQLKNIVLTPEDSNDTYSIRDASMAVTIPMPSTPTGQSITGGSIQQGGALSFTVNAGTAATTKLFLLKNGVVVAGPAQGTSATFTDKYNTQESDFLNGVSYGFKIQEVTSWYDAGLAFEWISGQTVTSQRTGVFTGNLSVMPSTCGQITLNWQMKNPSSTIGINTGGFNLQMRKAGESAWTSLPDVAYDGTTVNYASTIQLPSAYMNQTGIDLEFRIKRSFVGWDDTAFGNTASNQNLFQRNFTLTKQNTNYKGITGITIAPGASGYPIIKWSFTTEGLECYDNASLKLQIDNNSVINISDVKNTRSYQTTGADGVVSCVKQSYKLLLQYGSSPVTSYTVSNDYVYEDKAMRAFDNILVSKGYYPDKINIKWYVNKDSAQFAGYRLMRKLLSEPDDAYASIYEIQNNSGILQYSYDDMSVNSGIYYVYRVDGFYSCLGSGTSGFVSTPVSIGFSQPYGSVSGRITYAGSSAVAGVSVNLATNDALRSNRELAFSGDRANSLVTIPANANLLSREGFTYQAWIKPLYLPSGNRFMLISRDWFFSIDYNSAGVISAFFGEQGGSTYVRTPANMVNLGSYQHITCTVARDSDDYKTSTNYEIYNVSIYINGDSIISGKIMLPNPQVNSALPIYLGNGNNTLAYNGLMDDIRLWNRPLTANEIKSNYNIILSGKETGLMAYYKCDETDEISDALFDCSAVGTAFNGNHALKGSGVNRSDAPDDGHLSLKGITDKNGIYSITNSIPFTGQGTTYTISPVFGVHRFDPTQRPLFFSPDSKVFNNVDFTDVSSFTVAGTVTYAGGNYPVEGCTFEVDGSPVIAGNLPVTSDADGNFTISVPIGIHKVQIKKQGHIFADDGLLLENKVNINYNTNISGVHFQDLTRIKLIGHIVGGKRENGKASGFGLRINNIGSDVMTLTAQKNAYSFTKDFDTKINTPTDTVFLHNTNNTWAKWTRPGLRQDTTKMHVSDNAITVHVSPVTGEYVAWVYPEIYTIENISDANSNIIYNARETLDLSNTPVMNNDLLQTSAYTWTDSVWVAAQGNMQAHWENRNHTDTVRYNKEWGYYYQAQPSYTVQQLVNNQPVDYFGDKEYRINDSTTVQLLTNDNPPSYLFDKPVFRQGEPYTFGLSAFEEYKNPKIGLTDIVPVAGGQVSFSGELAMNSNPDPIELDSLGKGVYQFLGGMANLTTGVNEMSTMILIDNFPYYSVTFGSTGLSAYVMGGKSTGTDFLTAATDHVDFILHDPPGSSSYAYIEKGSSITTTHSVSLSEGVSENLSLLGVIGADVWTLAGFGVMVGTQTSASWKIGGKVDLEVDYQSNNTYSTKWNFTDRYSTSSDPLFVGHSADVFVGEGTNTLYGLTNNIAIGKTVKFDPANTLITKGDYTIGKQTNLAFGLSFGTTFAYTGYEVENIMIPKWKDALKNQFVFSDAGIDPNTIKNPVYVSMLPANDPNFGKCNNDTLAFGTRATSSLDNGPSYKLILPKALRDSLAAGWNKTPPVINVTEKTIPFTDSVIYYNDQIEQWKNILADNEKRKVDMINNNGYPAGNNISFGAGAKVDKSQALTTSQSSSKGVYAKHNVFVVFQNSIDVAGNGMEINNETGYMGNETGTWGSGSENTQTIGFELAETGTTDEISLDWGLDTLNYNGIATYIFRTRGGRTSCPYEGEVRTKYYQPGQFIIDEGTMQIEVPKIAVSGGVYRVQVPSTRPASFTLNLTNESETNGTGWFKLKVDEKTNPNGAVLSIDGMPIANGRYFSVPSGTVLAKTLTVEKGPNADSYDNIRLILASDCDFNLADTINISVDFLPACSDVDIKYPSDNWIINTSTGDSILVELENYDVNFANFGYVELQYRSKSETQWSSEMKFYSNQTRYNNAQGAKTLLGTDPTIKYFWHKGQKADGEYEFRAHTVCETAGGVFISETYTPAISGVVDMNPPRSLGAPSPANGILGAGDELSITFNEDIQTGMLTQNNFTITGVLNAQTIAEPNVGLAFTGGTQSAQTELPIFTGGSFSIETWFKRDANTAGTLFAFGATGNYLSLGFDATGKAVLKIGSETYTSTVAVANDATWKYIAMAYDRSANTVAVYEFEGATNNILFDAQTLKAVPETQGKLIVGNDFNALNGFKGAVSQLRFYGVSRTQGDISASMPLTLSGREYGLIGYWVMDEGAGTVAVDKARARNLVLNAGWYIYPSGYAKQTAGTNYFSIPVSTYPLGIFNDFTLEFWFRSTNSNQFNQTLFSAANGSVGTNATGGLTLYKSDGTVNQVLTTANLTDTQWHHVALSVRRGGSVNVYIDGESTAVFPETQIGTFASDAYYFGAKRSIGNVYSNYFAGYFDEIRIWNSALNRESVLLDKNSKLRGDEPGLQAYYPFETYTKQSNGLISVTQTNNNMTDTNAAGGTAALSTTALSVKDVRPVENVPFDFVSSSNKIVFRIKDDYFSRVEGTTLNITVNDVRDMHNNKSNTEQWTAYVKRNPLVWDSDPVSLTKGTGESMTFTAKITNTGGTTVSYSIENLPSWLTVSSSAGNLQPLASKDLTFIVYQGINTGNYETAIGLTSGNGVSDILPVQLKVTGQRPDWSVNPSDFESSMNITGRIQIAGVFQEDTDDLLAAFIGDRCVGVTSPVYVDANNAYFTFANIYGNAEHNNQPLTFKLWDASTGRIYPKIETSTADIRFAPSRILGTISSPILFNALNVAEQVIALNKGWTWISYNVLNDNPTIFNQMKSSLGNAGVLIKGRDAYIQQPGWSGTLTNISEKSMYVVNANIDNLLTLEGTYANPSTTPITLNKGWNWIGYIPPFTLPVKNALAGINAQVDDQIKGQTGYAVYAGGSNGWIGSLSYMEPGKGYMFYSNGTSPLNLIYPSTASQVFNAPALRSTEAVAPRWSVDISRFSGNMTLTGIAVNDNAEMRSDQVEISAFSGTECRGSALLQYEPNPDKYIGYLMIYGEGNETITLKVYDHAANKEYAANNSPFRFSADAIYGNPLQPYIVALGSTPTGIDNVNSEQIKIYPNPVSNNLYITRPWKTIDRVEISDLSGRIVFLQTDFIGESISVSAFIQGTYLLKLIHNETIVVRKFMKK